MIHLTNNQKAIILATKKFYYFDLKERVFVEKNFDDTRNFFKNSKCIVCSVECKKNLMGKLVHLAGHKNNELFAEILCYEDLTEEQKNNFERPNVQIRNEYTINSSSSKSSPLSSIQPNVSSPLKRNNNDQNDSTKKQKNVNNFFVNDFEQLDKTIKHEADDFNDFNEFNLTNDSVITEENKNQLQMNFDKLDQILENFKNIKMNERERLKVLEILEKKIRKVLA